MKIFRNLKLQYKMLILAIIPVLIMGIVAILISNTVVKNKLLDDAKQKLKATSNAVLAAYDQNAGDYFVNATGDVWKGAYNVSLSTPFIDDIAAKTGIEVTFFYNDTRLVTSLKDADGKRILGSKAGDFLVENVLQDGNEVFTNRVLVDGTLYFGYYVPVHQNNSDEIIGMVFAGMPVKESASSPSTLGCLPRNQSRREWQSYLDHSLPKYLGVPSTYAFPFSISCSFSFCIPLRGWKRPIPKTLGRKGLT